MSSNFDALKASVSLADYAAAHLQKSRGGLWCCPKCGSGTHGTPSSDGALSINGDHWHCFSCQSHGDVFDLAGILHGTEDKHEQLRIVADWAGIRTGGGSTSAANVTRPNPSATAPKAEKTTTDYSKGREAEAAYIRAAWEHIGDDEAVAYLSTRGISLDDAKKLGIGYDPQKRRIILPWQGCNWYHIDRAIDPEVNPKYTKPRTSDVGPQPLYNPNAAKADAFFIVEGVLDAMAVTLCGYEAIAVGSNNMSERNVSELTAGIKSHGGGTAIIMLDADDAGDKGASKLKAALDAAGVVCVVWERKRSYTELDGSCPVKIENPKDAAEWLQADRPDLTAHLKGRYDNAKTEAEEAREKKYRETLCNLKVVDPAEVVMDIYDLKDAAEPIPTGFKQLDEVLDGGLKPGLYGFGGVSSFGKTTGSVQVADHIAAAGHQVLFVTIEQSAPEIVAKSLSHLACSKFGMTISTNEATNPKRRACWDTSTTGRFMQVCAEYHDTIAPNLTILEGTDQPTVADVRKAAEAIARLKGQSPVIFIDYLQLLAPMSDRETDKQTVDNNMKSLRHLANHLKTPVWVISSLNRASYFQGVTLDSFKESGAIEYGCDVLLGLQPDGIRSVVNGSNDGNIKKKVDSFMRENKGKYDRECEIVVLKNRNGMTPHEGIPLTFKVLSSMFTERFRPLASHTL